VPLAGATAATLAFSPVLLENGGAYSVTVTNASGTAKSVPVALTVSGTGLDVSATQAVAGGGYAASGVVTINNTLTYTGTPTSLAWNANLPVGWTYISSGGAIGDVKPLEGTSGSLGWAWSTPPDGGVSFSYTLRVPAGTTGAQQISAMAIVRVGDAVVQRVAAPNPLGVPQFTTHSADTDADFRISLLELTRVIQLYNTRSGTTRTGAYVAAGGVTEDGFTPDFSRTVAATDLARFHSADTHTDALGSPPDGRINLTELTRVIELYNTRSGTMRTGAYHVASGTEDGFAPGP
jgi:hypothetical protein